HRALSEHKTLSISWSHYRLSLPLALELVDNQDSMNVDELCEHLTQIAKQTCVVWKQLATTEEDF
ncbi:hypothetical protein HEO57_020575, partial [Escherichia coli]|nr:hypothetical protein [Escherichia coli]